MFTRPKYLFTGILICTRMNHLATEAINMRNYVGNSSQILLEVIYLTGHQNRVMGSKLESQYLQNKMTIKRHNFKF